MAMEKVPSVVEAGQARERAPSKGKALLTMTTD